VLILTTTKRVYQFLQNRFKSISKVTVPKKSTVRNINKACKNIITSLPRSIRAPHAKDIWSKEQAETDTGYYESELQEMKSEGIPLNNVHFRMKIRKSRYENATTVEQREEYKQKAKEKQIEMKQTDIP
jgi:hypothetical protein